MPIYKRENGVYYIDITTRSGQRIRQSSRTKDKNEAQRLHDKLKHELWQQEHFNKKPKRLWDEAAVRWIEEMGDKKSIRDDISRLRCLVHFRGVFLHHMSRDFIMQTLGSMTCSDSTKNRYLALIRAILNKAEKEWGWLDNVPKLKLYREAKRRIRWLKHEEAQRLIDALPEYMADMAVFSLATGLRQSNVLGLKWTQINLERQTAWIEADEAKAGRAIGVAVNQTALGILEKRTGKHPSFVFTLPNGKPVKSISSRIWKNALSQAGITDFRWHDLRHTWASWLVQAGVPLAALQEMGGWENVGMVQKYAHLAPEHLHGHAAILDSVGLGFDTKQAHPEIGGGKEKSLNNCLGLGKLVGRERFERSTNGLKVRCSTD